MGIEDSGTIRMPVDETKPSIHFEEEATAQIEGKHRAQDSTTEGDPEKYAEQQRLAKELAEKEKISMKDFLQRFEAQFVFDYEIVGIKNTETKKGIRGDVQILTVEVKGEDYENSQELIEKKYVIKSAVKDGAYALEFENWALNYLRNGGVENIPKVDRMYPLEYGEGEKGLVMVMDFIEGNYEDTTVADIIEVAKTHDLARELGLLHMDISNNIIGGTLIDWSGLFEILGVVDYENFPEDMPQRRMIASWDLECQKRYKSPQNDLKLAKRFGSEEGRIRHLKIQFLEKVWKARFQGYLQREVGLLPFYEMIIHGNLENHLRTELNFLFSGDNELGSVKTADQAIAFILGGELRGVPFQDDQLPNGDEVSSKGRVFGEVKDILQKIEENGIKPEASEIVDSLISIIMPNVVKAEDRFEILITNYIGKLGLNNREDAIKSIMDVFNLPENLENFSMEEYVQSLDKILK